LLEHLSVDEKGARHVHGIHARILPETVPGVKTHRASTAAAHPGEGDGGGDPQGAGADQAGDETRLGPYPSRKIVRRSRPPNHSSPYLLPLPPQGDVDCNVPDAVESRMPRRRPGCRPGCYATDMAIDMRVLREKYAALAACLDEARLRLWAAAEARSLGHGGIESVARVTGLSRRTIHRGLEALRQRRGPAPLPRL
jgi:hypothetical protein